MLKARCNACHSYRTALDFRAASPAKAKALLDRMARRGAKVPISEQPLLISHFIRS